MTTTIRCGTLWDGTGSDPVPGAALTIEDGKFVAGPAPAEADDIDLRELFVMPGLVDAHNHVSIVIPLGDQWEQKRAPAVAQALRAPYNMRKDLAGGATTMRIMGEEEWIDLSVRAAIEDAYFNGPSLVCATRPLAPSNGFGRITHGYDGVDDIRKVVRENLYRGADFIKVFATGGSSGPGGATKADYTYDELRVIVEEAERSNTYVAAHATGGPGLTDAIRAGVGTVEHASHATEEQIALLEEHGTWVVATLGILFSPDGIEAGEPERAPQLRQARVRVEETMRRLFASNVKVALGTDHVHGGMPFEIQTAIRFGMAPRDALLAATARAAEAIRVDARAGSLVPGKDADVIALAGNPLEDPTALDRIRFVMRHGRRLV
jgi:imidazolonepropionase-like amidohydrolase